MSVVALAFETWLASLGGNPVHGADSMFNGLVAAILVAVASGVVSAAHLIAVTSSRKIASAALVASAAAVIWPLAAWT